MAQLILSKLSFSKLLTLLLILSSFLIFEQNSFAQYIDTTKLHSVAKVLSFNPDSSNYQSIFDGEKDTVVFYSGVVTLFPNQSVETHNTGIYEEMIVILEGEGKLLISDKNSYDLKYGKIAFCPPFTEHNVINTGTKKMKYIYIATKSK